MLLLELYTSQKKKKFHHHAGDFGLMVTRGTFLPTLTMFCFSSARLQLLGQPALLNSILLVSFSQFLQIKSCELGTDQVPGT